ncbi:MAG: SMC-Scp complex subunit ScpB [Candidatus Onthoplasma sp.]
MNLNEIAKIIEGVLFVSGEGVEIDEFKNKYEMNDREFNKCLDILKERFNEQTGINIIKFKNKIQLCSNPNIANEIADILNPIRERSLTKTALETVAIIAYKQPITRVEIEGIRGANSDYAIQLLQSNNLIEVVGRKDTVGKPLLFGTTDNFLKRFGLESLDKLPNYNELLDRIRVIHSEGDSLYREFKILEESEEANVDDEKNIENDDENQSN